MKKTKIIYCLFIIIAFVIGILIGKSFNHNEGLDYILNIDQWKVKKLSREGTIIYASNDKSYISDDQKEGWHELLEIISMKGYRRNKTVGSTAHTMYEIEMKNGKVYYIEYLGCQNQVDITYPGGIKIKYYGYN